MVTTTRERKPAIELLARLLPPASYLRLYGRAKTGAWPDLRDPRRFSERLLRRMLDADLAPLARTGDKYTLREYVSERIGGQYLAALLDVFERGERVTHARMAGWPERGVLKASHASAWMRYVERDAADPAELDALVRTWTSRSYAGVRQERHYALMTPRALLEEDLSRDGVPPRDVKLFVFERVPRLLMVDTDRFGDHRRYVADPEWRPLAVRYLEPPPERDPEPPSRLAEMIEVASTLAAPFPFVRVDLYQVDDRVLVGEMTHFPGAGAPRFEPRGFDAELGAVWGERRPVDPRWRRDPAREGPA